jgi:hypothetical protein
MAHDVETKIIISGCLNGFLVNRRQFHIGPLFMPFLSCMDLLVIVIVLPACEYCCIEMPYARTVVMNDIPQGTNLASTSF